MNYTVMHNQLRELTQDIPHPIANMANAAALLWQCMDTINWAGFYLLENDTLVLGPFQGKPAAGQPLPGAAHSPRVCATGPLSCATC